MNNKNSNQRLAEQAKDTLDALLRKGVQADQRASKPSTPAALQAPHYQPPPPARPALPPLPSLERLTVRFTQSEGRLLEKARGVARSMGYKVSDTAVFRLALNAFEAERMTSQQIENVLQADGRRK